MDSREASPTAKAVSRDTKWDGGHHTLTRKATSTAVPCALAGGREGGHPFLGLFLPTPLAPPWGRARSYRTCFPGDINVLHSAAGPVETIFAPRKQKHACFSTNLSNNPGGAWTCSPSTSPALPAGPQSSAHQLFVGEKGKSKIQWFKNQTRRWRLWISTINRASSPAVNSQ